MEIPKIKLNNGLNIPVIGLGTWKLNGEECIDSVKKALELGYIHIDTAEIYGNQREISEAIKGNREKLFITSKVWHSNLDYDNVIKACDETLSDLGIKFIDLYLIHFPNRNIPIKETLRALKKLLDEGKIKSIGVSNFTIKHLKDSLDIAKEIDIKITNNQVEFHPLLYQKDLLDFCKENDVVLTAYSPLAKGMVKDNETLKRLGEKYGKTASQISLKWLLERGMIVIPKAVSKEHLKENLEIFDFNITKEDLEEIDSIDENNRITDPSIGEYDYK